MGVILYRLRIFFLLILEEPRTHVKVMMLNVSLNVIGLPFVLDGLFCSLVSEVNDDVKMSPSTFRTIFLLRSTVFLQLEVNAINYNLGDHMNHQSKLVGKCRILRASAVFGKSCG